MRKIATIILICLSFTRFCYAQEVCDKNTLLKNTLWYEPETEPMSMNGLSKFDFENIWAYNKISYLGYIGDNFQRLHFEFTEIEKESPTEYSVKGQTKVKDNVCTFSGVITITNIGRLKEFNTEFDEIIPVGGISDEGYIQGEYTLNEDKTKWGTGVFKGTFVSLWYRHTNGELHYDDITIGADSYSNNQFAGTWTSYKTKAVKKTGWGQYRIPCSGDLDYGAGEFSVNPKYKKNGWEGSF